jgi:hypothetical protein
VFLDASRKVAARATSISMCYRVGIALNLLQQNTVGDKRANAGPCMLRDTSASHQLELVSTDRVRWIAPWLQLFVGYVRRRERSRMYV